MEFSSLVFLILSCSLCYVFALSPKQEVCLLQVDEGPCGGDSQRYYYNTITQQCEEFSYGGCQGNGNNFMSFMECKKACFRIPKIPQICRFQKEEGHGRAIYRDRPTERPTERNRERQRTRDHSMKMIKSVVVVMFLNMLHLCLGNNVRTEILEDLESLTRKNFAFTFLNYRVPTPEMEDNARECKCQGVFATELKRVVNKVEAQTEEHKLLLNRLKKNIQALPQISTPEEASICPMMDKKLPLDLSRIVLMKYILFLKNLNENDCV